MIAQIAAAWLICATAFAQPASQPATQPAAAETSQTKYPTPTELVEKLKQLKQQQTALTRVAYISLDNQVAEKPGELSLFGLEMRQTLHGILNRLRQARDDQSIPAVLITLGAGLDLNFAQAQELRDALLELRRAGKKIFIYADAYDTIAYTIASGATDVCLPAGGMILMPGVGLQAIFFKGTMDKIGVQADFVQIGEYKGADEPFTRTAPSEELSGELNKLTESLFEQIVQGISIGRNLPRQNVRQAIDQALIPADMALRQGLVDHLVEQDGLRALLSQAVGNDIDLVHGYGEPDRPEVDFSNIFSLLAAMSRRPQVSQRPAVALIYAEGIIYDGDGQGSLFDDSGVASESMRRTLRQAARDENIKAVVLRIDSPGGSALASEVIWQAIRRLSQEHRKPVIVSIGSVAASGGYYVASAGDYIFADRCSLVGSIGVVGGKLILKGLFDKLGLATASFTRGDNADLFSSTQPFTDQQRQLLRQWMQHVYDQFTGRVMAMRQGKIQDIDKVARGRVFLAQQARELGLVDELGGCQAAIAYAASQAGLESGSYDVRILPPPRTLADLLSGRSDQAALPVRPDITIQPDSPLLVLPRSVRRQLARQILLMQLLDRHPVALVWPYGIVAK